MPSIWLGFREDDMLPWVLSNAYSKVGTSDRRSDIPIFFKLSDYRNIEYRTGKLGKLSDYRISDRQIRKTIGLSDIRYETQTIGYRI
jgi:hypothetical protein